MGTSDAPPALIPPQLLTEALGFSPQLLLDDIINVANHAVQDGVNGTEDFLQQRTAQLGEADSTQEIEQRLVAFQTLLEFHTDVALTSCVVAAQYFCSPGSFTACFAASWAPRPVSHSHTMMRARTCW
ncbi:Centromere protein mis12 [Mycena sanguinolenta]|uniref:Centromere protein mis12 n=1 Tax=Mycena sanguinolenta TaxID=230812 RepID=A0A8H7CHA6_9AGAR|nr:Centromere protein mis12 [Mycena sanguinolenta]